MKQDRLYLHIGCGKVRLPGFINIDAEGAPDVRLDVRDGLPFPPGSVQGIYTEHFVEHLDQGELLAFLRDCRRVLAPGGRLRIATPDLAQTAREYLDGSWLGQPWLKAYGYEWIRTGAEYLNVSMRDWGHKWLLDAEELERLLRLAGFDTIGPQPLGQSPDPMLSGRETRDRSFVLEAVQAPRTLGPHPLVSIVIPAYKPQYLKDSLESALSQTYASIEVLVLDDSPDDRIADLVRPYAERDKRLRYVRNPQSLGEPANLTQGIRLALGELIKPLYDDDLLLPEAVERLVAALQRHPEASLAACRRLAIDANGNLAPVRLPDLPEALRGQDVIRGDWVIASISALGENWLGEPSVMLFRRADALAIEEPDVMSLFGRLCYGIGDVCLATHLLGRGDLVWVDAPLGRFRLHAQQTQQEPGFRARAVETWAYFRLHADRLGFRLPRAHPDSVTGGAPYDVNAAQRTTTATPTSKPENAAGGQVFLTRIDSLAALIEPHLKGRRAILLIGTKALDLLTAVKEGEDPPWVGALMPPAEEAPPLADRADWQERAWLSQLASLPRTDIDTVVCAGYLEVCPDSEAELAALRRRLDDTARVVFAVDHAAALERLDRLARGLPAEAERPGERLFTLTQLQTLLERHGFRVAAWYGVGSRPFARGVADQAGHVERLDTGTLSVHVRDPLQQRLLETHTLVAVAQPDHARITLEADPQELYLLWQAAHVWPEWLKDWIRSRAGAMDSPPHIHLGIVLADGRLPALYQTLAAMGEQIWERWQISIVARLDCPPALATLQPVVQWRQIGPDDNAIAALNRVLLETPADLVGQLEAGDRLAPQALALFADKFDRHPQWQAAYSDEDQLDPEGGRCNPFFKTDFDIDALRAAPFTVGGLWLVRQGCFARLGGFRPDLEGVETYDLQLRAWEAVGDAGIGHIADVLYHRDPNGGHATDAAESLAQRRRLALQGHLDRLGLAARLDEGPIPGLLHVRYRHTEQPLVSICIPSKNRLALLRRCLESVLSRTAYPNYEIIVVDNGSDANDEVWAYYDSLRARLGGRFTLLRYDAPFNYAAMMNLAAEAAQGDFLLHLNNDTAILDAEWLDALLELGLLPGVGIVGARLLFPDGRLQHVGCVLGLNGLAAEHPHLNAVPSEPGYFARLNYAHQVSAVTGACLLIRRGLYRQLGGMDAENCRVKFNDIDLCLKARAAGLRVLWTPHATLMHEASATQRQIVEEAAVRAANAELFSANKAMFARWGSLLGHDPFYNRNLSLDGRQAYRLELVPALTWDPELKPVPRILAHPADRQGSGEYRILAPLRVLNRSGRAMGWETGGYLSGAEIMRMQPDVIVLQRQVTEEQIGLIERYRRVTSAFKVFEIDDLITNVPVKSPVRQKMVEQKDLYKRFRKAVGLCDRLVVSTDSLAEAYRRLADSVVVVQNHLEGEVWLGLAQPQRREGKPRVGWAGALQHHGDLAVITEVIKATAHEVDWVFLGMCLDEVKPYVKEFHPGVPLADYPAKLASLDLDLAVAPLEDVPFNHAKSHLRLLEYGILGYPVICTDITPYRGAYPVTRVPNRFKAWREAILERVGDRDALRAEGERLREYVRREWILEDHLDRWLGAWLPPSI